MFERLRSSSGAPRARERDQVIPVAKDLSRTVDYLQTRPDMDLDKLAFIGGSWGANFAPTLLVVEPRFKTAVLIAGGYHIKQLPEVDPFQFAPFVKIPILMVNGRYDPGHPLKASQEPMHEDLKRANPETRHVMLNSRHAPPVDETLELVNEWLRERFR